MCGRKLVSLPTGLQPHLLAIILTKWSLLRRARFRADAFFAPSAKPNAPGCRRRRDQFRPALWSEFSRVGFLEYKRQSQPGARSEA